MGTTEVQRLARVLRTLVKIAFIFNIICLMMSSMVVFILQGVGEDLLYTIKTHPLQLTIRMPVLVLLGYVHLLKTVEDTILLMLVLVCGVCTATILWQAKRILDTILEGNPFQITNAISMKRAAGCCWIISAASLGRLLLWRLWSEGEFPPLFSYNTLFIPAFLMAGLLFLVMSALFRQAAELQEDRDLTI